MCLKILSTPVKDLFCHFTYFQLIGIPESGLKLVGEFIGNIFPKKSSVLFLFRLHRKFSTYLKHL